MSTLEKIRDILHTEYGTEPSDIELDSRLSEDLNLDSLDLVELMLALEEVTGRSISDEEASELKTIGQVVNLIENSSRVPME